MDKPTLQEVKEYFKNAKEVKSTFGKTFNYLKSKNLHLWNGAYFVSYKNEDYCIWDKWTGFSEIISYKEPLYQLTAREVVHAYENPQWLKDNFKECFESDLEVNKWYKYSDRIGFIVYIEKVLSNTLIKGYGISNCWNDSREWVKEGLEPATEKEVEEALKNYFEKINGIKFNNYKFVLESNKLIGWDFDYTLRFTLFHNGKFIETPTYTIPEAEEKFNIKIKAI